MAYGLTALGFIPKTYEICRAERVARFILLFGGGYDLSNDKPLGKFLSLESEREAEIWEALEACVDAGDPDKVSGALQDALYSLTGTWRKLPVGSLVVLTLTGDDLTPVPALESAKNSITSELFQTQAIAVLSLGVAWLPSIAYSIGDIRTNDGKVYRCILAGTSAVVTGPEGTGFGILDGTAEWDYMGDGLAHVDVLAQSVTPGAIVGNSGEINEIQSAVSGWLGVVNVLDAVLGRTEETPEDFRERRELELATPGTTTVDAVQADLMKFVPDIISAKGFWNHFTPINSDGVPGHSVEYLIDGGTDQDIWDALLKYVGGGTETHGTEKGVSLDSKGSAHTMGFSRVTKVPIYVEVTVTYDDNYSQDGDDQIKAAIATISKGNGYDAVAMSVYSACESVTGVLDVISVSFGLAPSPVTSTPVAIGTRSSAEYDTSRVVVTSSEATP